MYVKQKVFIIIGIITIILVSFLVGLYIGKKNVVKDELAMSKQVYGQTFYANIENIKEYNNGGFYINVRGLEVNDINYRGKFTFNINDNIDMTWRGEKIGISDLKEGDIISITFTDKDLMDISPTPLKEVVKVQLLEDER